MKRIAYWALPLMLIGALTAPVLAQAQQAQQAQPKQQDPKWNDTKEYNDYIAVYEQKDQAKRAEGAEKFFVDHKNADPIALTEVYKYMLFGYANSSNWKKTLETIERQSMAPKLTEADKKQYDQIGLVAAASSKDNPKTVEYAEKVLKNDPKNFNALITLSGVLSQTLPPTNPAKDQQIEKTLVITKQALEQPRPQGVTEAQWNPIQQQLRETTCLMLLNQKKYPESIAECQAALKINPKDGFAYYWIGLSHKSALIDLSKKYNEAVDNYNAHRTDGQLVVDEMREKMEGAQKVATDKRDETVDAFAKAVAVGGEAGKQAMTELQAIFQGTPAELNQLIEEKKKQLGD
jgi:hypothetical protein